jgi:predicted GNAT superfamily acetyltransferase
VPLLRPVRDQDIPAVLELNARNVEALAPMDEARLHELRGLADRFDVLEHDGCFAGFVITFAPGTSYDSENYRWFSERYDEFCYLDRIVLREDRRRQGLGTFVYDEVEAAARPRRRLALEVNLVPRNDVSLAFHARRGYKEVGRLGDERHLVALMEKPL